MRQKEFCEERKERDVEDIADQVFRNCLFLKFSKHDTYTILNNKNESTFLSFNQAQKISIWAEAIDFEYHALRERVTLKCNKHISDINKFLFAWNI